MTVTSKHCLTCGKPSQQVLAMTTTKRKYTLNYSTAVYSSMKVQ